MIDDRDIKEIKVEIVRIFTALYLGRMNNILGAGRGGRGCGYFFFENIYSCLPTDNE